MAIKEAIDIAKAINADMEQMHRILENGGVQKAGIFAHNLPEPSRMSCLKQLRLDVSMDYTVFEEQWVLGIIDGRIK